MVEVDAGLAGGGGRGRDRRENRRRGREAGGNREVSRDLDRETLATETRRCEVEELGHPATGKPFDGCAILLKAHRGLGVLRYPRDGREFAEREGNASGGRQVQRDVPLAPVLHDRDVRAGPRGGAPPAHGSPGLEKPRERAAAPAGPAPEPFL